MTLRLPDTHLGGVGIGKAFNALSFSQIPQVRKMATHRVIGGRFPQFCTDIANIFMISPQNVCGTCEKVASDLVYGVFFLVLCFFHHLPLTI